MSVSAIVPALVHISKLPEAVALGIKVLLEVHAIASGQYHFAILEVVLGGAPAGVIKSHLQIVITNVVHAEETLVHAVTCRHHGAASSLGVLAIIIAQIELHTLAYDHGEEERSSHKQRFHDYFLIL